MLKRLVPFLILIAMTSCVPAAIVGGIAKSASTKKQRANFMTEFQKTNTDREAKGLKPLDWCSEVYKFDKGWANNQDECKARIKAYEAKMKDKNAEGTEIKL